VGSPRSSPKPSLRKKTAGSTVTESLRSTRQRSIRNKPTAVPGAGTPRRTTSSAAAGSP
jgi:hypothetical protein